MSHFAASRSLPTNNPTADVTAVSTIAAMSTQSQEPKPRRSVANSSGWRRLVRDIAVNVAANLITAAVIYLAGVVSGVIPRNPSLITTALVIVSSSGSICLYVAARIFLYGRAQGYAFGWMMTLLGVGVISSVFAVGKQMSSLDRTLYPIMGVAALFSGIMMLLAVKNGEIHNDD